MTSSDDWRAWEQKLMQQLALGVAAARTRAGLSQRQLAEAADMSQGAIANIETGPPRVKQAPSVAVLIRLAVALEVPPVQLLYPDLPDGRVEVWPSVQASSIDALQWFSGEISSSRVIPTGPYAGSDPSRVNLARELERNRRALRTLRLQLLEFDLDPEAEKARYGTHFRDGVRRLEAETAGLEETLRGHGATVDESKRP